MGNQRNTWLLWLSPILISVAVTGGLLMFGRLADLWVAPDDSGSLLRAGLLMRDAGVAREIILGVLEILAAIFAIMITVVAIIVQLSATRYTSRVVDLFLADPFNILVFFAYVVPLIHGVWLANLLHEGVAAQVSVALFMGLATFSIILVIPYFQYVFVFLQPRHIIERIEHSIERSLGEAIRNPRQVERPQHEVSNSIRQLSDIALSSIAQADNVLAMHCIKSIRQAAEYYVDHKADLPAAWFEVDANHIVGLSGDVWREMVSTGTWMEMEVFKQYEIAFTNSLRKARDVNSYVARGMREVAEAAARRERWEALDLLVKGLNTFIAYALAERDIRSVVHVLYHYRLLAEAVLHRPELVQRIAVHLRYYAHNSQRRGIFFIIDAISYDLRVLIEHAFEAQPATAELLLGTFLELDQAAESKEELTRMRGVRKSQAMLAGYFIRAGRLDLAKRIHDDMAAESHEFLTSVRHELFDTQSKEFWEIEDRGVSFYYVDEPHRESVSEFFAWLLGERPLPSEIAQSA